MGFFKKIFKGIKKVFKKIGKGIKSAFKKVGKFMGKIGIVGQLGLALIMPYALPALGGFLGGAATAMMNTGVGGFLGTAIKGAGHFLNAAVNVGTRVGTAFKSVTSAVTDTIGNMVGATVQKIPGAGDFLKGVTGGKIDITDLNFENAWAKTQDAWGKAGSDLNKLFSKSTFTDMNQFTVDKFKALDAEKMKNTYQNIEDDTYKKLTRGEYTVDKTGGIVEKTQLEKVQSGIYTTDEAGTVKFKDDVSLLGEPAKQMSTAESLGTKAKGLLAEQGVEMSLVGVGNLADQYMAANQQGDFRESVQNPMLQFVDQSALQTSPIQTSPGLASSNMMAGMGGYSDFTQIQQDILNSNFTNMYSQGYYGAPSLQAGLALAYEELAA